MSFNRHKTFYYLIKESFTSTIYTGLIRLTSINLQKNILKNCKNNLQVFLLIFRRLLESNISFFLLIK
jgi:hypothetical protein